MRRDKTPSKSNRLKVKGIERKFNPALRLLGATLSQTSNIPDELLGYQINCGSHQDAQGRTWQIQAHAVCAKRKHLKENKVLPMIKKSPLLWLRITAKRFIDWSENN